MATIEIKAYKNDIYTEVYKVTGYVAKKELTGNEEEDGNKYEKISSNETNEEILNTYFNEAKADVLREVRNYLKNAPSDTDFANSELYFGLFMTLTMPNNWDISHENTVKTSLHNYLVSYIVSKWMRLTKNEEEKKYAEDCVKDMENFKYALHSRKSLGRDFFNI